MATSCGFAFAAPAAFAAPPSNDDFADAATIPGDSATVAGTNAEATAEPGEPNHDDDTPVASVWYRWTPSADYETTIDLCGSNYDSILAVYTGSALGSLTRVASNDDSSSCTVAQSRVEFEADGGTTYWIAVDGFGGATGTIDLDISTVLIPPPPPPGPAEVFYVRMGGTGTACTLADPCGTIAEALTAHRVSSGPGDVIDIGPGDWTENVDAGDDDDNGLIIRGTLGAGGGWDTTISGDGGGAGCSFACVVRLGAGGVNVMLRDIEVTNADAEFHVGPVIQAGGSDLDNVHAFAVDASFTTAAVVLSGSDHLGKFIEDSVIEGRENAVGIWGRSGLTVRDSDVSSDYQAVQALGCGCPATNELRIVRSWIHVPPADGQPVMNLAVGLNLDSSLVTGGGTGAWYQGDFGRTWVVENSTIDVGDPGVDDGSSYYAIDMTNQGSDDVNLDVDSSILVEQIETYGTSEPSGTISCVYSDIGFNAISPEWTNECTPGSRDNTNTDPATLFTGGSPFNWTLAPGSSAIDTGNPAALGPGVSTTDLAGDARVVPHTTATCPAGIRDRGAYEAAGVDCPTPPPPPPPIEERTLTVAVTGSGAGAVAGDGIDCGGEGHTDCTETVADGTELTLTAAAGANSSFAGFTGSCSESPCTITMDADRSVEAAFAPNGEPDTWFVKRPRKPWHRNPVFIMRTWPYDSPLECRLDDESYAPCESKVKLRGLEPGRHTFRARSFAFGMFDPTPSKKTFRIPG